MSADPDGACVNGRAPARPSPSDPVVDALGATLVAPIEREPGDIPLVWEGATDRRGADGRRCTARSTA